LEIFVHGIGPCLRIWFRGRCLPSPFGRQAAAFAWEISNLPRGKDQKPPERFPARLSPQCSIGSSPGRDDYAAGHPGEMIRTGITVRFPVMSPKFAICQHLPFIPPGRRDIATSYNTGPYILLTNIFCVSGFRFYVKPVNEPACPAVALAKADERARVRVFQSRIQNRNNHSHIQKNRAPEGALSRMFDLRLSRRVQMQGRRERETGDVRC